MADFNLYNYDKYIVSFSGGKDSTATLQLVWFALSELPKEKLHKPVHIMHTNTLTKSNTYK